MSKKLILSQAQVDRLTEASGMGDYINPSSEVGAVGHNEVALEPSDMRDSKDKERDSSVEYKPVQTDDIKNFMNVPQLPWGGSHIRTPYAAGYIAETYTKEEFEKLAMDENNQQLNGIQMTTTLNTPQGTVMINGDENKLSTDLTRAKQAGNKELANALQKTLDNRRKPIRQRKKTLSNIGVQGQYRNSAFNDVYGTNN